jgi:predicted ATPase/DNA-binding winged helix-turn-helix (wHTH) protein
LSKTNRLLERDGRPVKLGGRAFDILIALADRAGQIVSQTDLIQRAWPNLVVEEVNLRSQITRLRRVLGDGRDGARYIATIPGRGYSLVIPTLERKSEGQQRGSEVGKVESRVSPSSVSRIVGRDDDESHFAGGVAFVDLGTLTDAGLIPSAVSTALGIKSQADDPLPSLLATLRDRDILIVLDTCEHVVTGAADLAERMYWVGDGVHLLTTSREPLRAEGERIYQLRPLETPPEGLDLSAAEVLATPSVQLFMDRAEASGHSAPLSDEDASTVADICRGLDGLPLAIELAASRVGTYGIRGTATLLNDPALLLLQSRRGAQTRHRTLHAMVNWSYGLLCERDRRVFQRLSVFMGRFTAEAALGVASSSIVSRSSVADALGSLLDKSLISVRLVDGVLYHHLLDTTRAFATDMLAVSGDADLALRAHARYFCDLLSNMSGEPSSLRDAYRPHADDVPNVRAALDWGLSDRGDRTIGLALAAASAPLFLELSLLAECYRWSHRAINVMRDFERGTHVELNLQIALVISGIFNKGNTPDVAAAIVRGIELARALGDKLRELKLQLCFHMFHIRSGQIKRSLELATQAVKLAYEIGDEAGIAIAHRMHGISCALSGDRIEAIRHFELGFSRETQDNAIDFLGQTHGVGALVAYSRTLWLTGHPSKAVAFAKKAIVASDATSHPVSACNCYAYAVQVFLWSADLDTARLVIDRLIEHANRYSLAAFQAMGLGLKGQLSIALGDHQTGKSLLEAALAGMQAERQNTFGAPFRTSLAEALAATGDFDGALVALDAARTLAEETGGQFHLPETLRLKGVVLASRPDGDLLEAEGALLHSIDLARRQGSPGWELRTSVTLAHLHIMRGECETARTLLADLCNRFSGDFETDDLAAARDLIEALEAGQSLTLQPLNKWPA